MTGPTRGVDRYLAGGWTAHWQGAESDAELAAQGESIVDALRRLAPAGVIVTNTTGMHDRLTRRAATDEHLRGE